MSDFTALNYISYYAGQMHVLSSNQQYQFEALTPVRESY